MKIVFCAAEAAPFAKVGGLADVVGSLPQALTQLGQDIIVILPKYGLIDTAKFGFVPTDIHYRVVRQGHAYPIRIWQGAFPQTNIPVYLIDQPHFFGDRQTVYPYGEPVFETEGFLLFSQAILTLLEKIPFKPDILHVHDWHTSPVAVDLKQMRHHASFFHRTHSVLTIHNLAYQGICPTPHGDVNWLLEGIKYADFITTVSPTYAAEIQTPEGGVGLDEMIRWRTHDVRGILNGLDVEAFNPATDDLLPQKYSLADWQAGKAACKLDMQQALGLESDPEIPLVALISRFVEQKGIDIAIEAISRFLETMPNGAQFMLLGNGEHWLEESVRHLSSRFPHIKNYIGFHHSLAQKLYAASDLFLMPSRFEPCGLGQMIAMRYGSVPIVRATGGLVDTVRDIREQPDGNGFRFYEVNPGELVDTLTQACRMYHDKPFWEPLVERGMSQDLSWTRSAQAYLAVYQELAQRGVSQESGIGNRYLR